MKLIEAVSKRIIELCNQNNITPNRLSEISTIAPSTLRDTINCNVSKASINLIYEVCKALNITLEDFFTSKYFKDIID